MTLLFRVLYAAHCRSTHHKLALNALNLLRANGQESWRTLFLKNHSLFLHGAKDPDNVFKDFRNHVLHPGREFWGGAPKTARKWYETALLALRQKQWDKAVYATGVLSHYCTDPIQPFHTDSSEEENNIHRAAEWSITLAHDELWVLAQKQGLPRLTLSTEDNWLELMIQQTASYAHQHYWPLIEHYDFDVGVKKPPQGLDEVARRTIADLLGLAAVSFARVMDRLLEESGVAPPMCGVTLETILATLTMPIKWVTKKIANAQERRVVEAMYEELQRTGKVEATLPEDDRMIREACRNEVKSRSEKPKTIPTQAPQPEALRYYLMTSSDIEEAPSIGPKTAARLEKANIHTVQDLLEADPETTAALVEARHITPSLILDWKAQAILVCTIPNLRGHDSQILVACGYRSREEVAKANEQELLRLAVEFAKTNQGERIIRSGKVPDLEEVRDWIRWATQEPLSQAA